MSSNNVVKQENWFNEIMKCTIIVVFNLQFVFKLNTDINVGLTAPVHLSTCKNIHI